MVGEGRGGEGRRGEGRKGEGRGGEGKRNPSVPQLQICHYTTLHFSKMKLILT